jgi:SulP family sulfate permease
MYSGLPGFDPEKDPYKPVNLARHLPSFLPRTSDYPDLKRNWRSDLIAGVTVGVVALPLALAFGITTGLGAASGLVTAVVAGLVAAVFGGSNVQVSGPTGAMTVVLVPIVARYGVDAVFVVSIMAGLLIMLSAVLRLGRYLEYMPWPVFEGFTIGIAIIIFLQQVPSALGVEKPDGERTAVVAAEAVRDALEHGVPAAMALVVLVAVVMVGAPKIRRGLPGSLIAVALATVVAEALSLKVDRIGLLPSSLPSPSLPSSSFTEMQALASAAFAVAALAAIESLLSAKVADGMSDTSRHDPDRELWGQGLANVVSPLFGGMPATGAIARTAVNVRSGARSRLSSIIHAIVLLAVVYFGTGLVSRIPLAALAGVLMVTAFRMAERHNIMAVLRSTRSDAAVLGLTAVCTVAFDLIVAVEVGVIAAAFLALRHIALASDAETESVRDHVEIDSEDEARLLHEHIVVYRLDGALFFGAAQRFLTMLTRATDIRVVILRMSGITVLDATGAKALGEIVNELQDRGITVLFKGVRPRHVQILEAVGALNRTERSSRLFATMPDAIEFARRQIRALAPSTVHGSDDLTPGLGGALAGSPAP